MKVHIFVFTAVFLSFCYLCAFFSDGSQNESKKKFLGKTNLRGK